MFDHCLICTILIYIYISFKYTFAHLYGFICSHLLIFIEMLSVFLFIQDIYSFYSKGNFLSIICGKYFPLKCLFNFMF